MSARFTAAIALAASLVAAGSVFAGPIAVPSSPPGSTLAMSVDDGTMTVTSGGGDVNLRLEPSTRSQVIDKLPRGTKVTVINMVDGGKWVHVKVGDKEGYIARYLLRN